MFCFDLFQFNCLKRINDIGLDKRVNRPTFGTTPLGAQHHAKWNTHCNRLDSWWLPPSWFQDASRYVLERGNHCLWRSVKTQRHAYMHCLMYLYCCNSYVECIPSWIEVGVNLNVTNSCGSAPLTSAFSGIVLCFSHCNLLYVFSKVLGFTNSCSYFLLHQPTLCMRSRA